MTRPSRRTAAGTALAAVVALVASLTAALPAHADTLPTVNITSPIAGAAASGTDFPVDVTASTDPGGTDAPATITLLVDSIATGTPFTCGADQTCNANLSWDTTDVVGNHLLSAQVTTVGNVTQTSSTVSVTVNPLTVAITPPGGAISGQGTLTVTGSTPTTAPDQPSLLELLLGATVLDSATCAANPCSADLGYDVTKLSGPVTFTARLTTAIGGITSRTATTTLDATVSNNPPTVSISAPAAGSTVVGPTDVTVSASTPRKLSDYPASIAVVVDKGLAGEHLLGTVPCTGSPDHTCSGTLPWDATGLTGTHTLDATVTTTNSVTASSATRTVTASSPAPAVTITSPSNGTSVSGTVVVTADATTNGGLSELASSVALLVDGTQVDNQACTVPLSHDCPITLSWDATAVTGGHVLTTVVTTTLGRTATSDPVTVPVTTPPFDVAVTSPAALTVLVGSGATATSSGIVSVGVSGATDVTQNEFPTGLELLVDGVVVDSAGCPGNPTRTCTATLHWNASRAAGPHRLSARLTTSRGHTGTSASVVVLARSGSKTGLTRIAPSLYGGIASIRGQVVSTTSGLALPGLYVKVVLAPAIGRARTVVVKTDINGRFLVRTRVYTNTRVTASVGRNWLTSSSAITLAGVKAPMSCATTASAYLSLALGRGSCSVRSLPVGTIVRLRYYYAGRWSTLASGRTSSTFIPFSFRFRPRGTYYLQVTLGANRLYVATGSRLMRVVIR
ncbi:MAG TPA: Ig-like domain-containing protein [Candidatus Nanopelagicales bacterium]|nr:Ig-like domain-containing protein [Candidatus Nanopelagicales bacterium]